MIFWIFLVGVYLKSNENLENFSDIFFRVFIEIHLKFHENLENLRLIILIEKILALNLF